ncbi:MAG: adenosylcobinamide-phosphate synthase CbiB [Lachnospiraceae bacterium]|nr:adenosylcobinamide-phosphate synthase CbiB [Lachnospiraceae bacterium]
MKILYLMAGAFLLDLCFGDPESMPHVVRLIGLLIGKLDGYFRSLTDRLEEKEEKGRMEFLCGILLCFLVLGLVWIIWSALTVCLYSVSGWAGFIPELLLSYQLLAVKSLKQESRNVYQALKERDISASRKAVSRIVGRDTDRLGEEGITKAAVETVAENLSDGVIAPLFYLALGGTTLMLLYKAVNTMDSMIGYKNSTYFYFGKCAARLDDVLNFIPSRISGLLLVLAAFIGREDGKKAWEIFKRDRKKHASPNSAQTEAAMAGALHLQLAGDAWYFGQRHEKPLIGDPLRPAEPEDILKADRLLYISAGLGLFLFGAVRAAVLLLLTAF